MNFKEGHLRDGGELAGTTAEMKRRSGLAVIKTTRMRKIVNAKEPVLAWNQPKIESK